jgi:hypothetical protein
MMTIVSKSLNLFEQVVNTLEQYDDNMKRERIFAPKTETIEKDQTASTDGDSSEVTKEENTVAVSSTLSTKEQLEKFKYLTYELADISIHQGQKQLGILKQSNIYLKTDPYVKYDEKIQVIQEKSIKMYNFVNDKIYCPLKNNLYVFYDKNIITIMVSVLFEHQQKVKDYVLTHYTNVTVQAKENWLKLDFDNDGVVSKEDL